MIKNCLLSKNKLFLLFTFIFLQFDCIGQLANGDFTSTRKAISKLEHSVELKNSLVSYSVQKVDGSEYFYSQNAHKLMRPASTLKVLSSWIAYRKFGAKYKFATTLGYTGSIKNSVLYGDIIIEGNGDPTLGSTYRSDVKDVYQLLSYWTSAIKETITRIEGNIVIIDKKYNDMSMPETWSWDDIGNYYGSSAYAININENSYFLDLYRRNSLGGKIEKYKIRPHSPYVNIKEMNVVEAEKGSGDQAYIFGSPFSDERIVNGSIPVGSGVYTIKGSLPYPGKHLAYWLKQELIKERVTCHQILSKSHSDEFIPLNKVESPPLRIISLDLLHKSNNLYTEALLNLFGSRYEGLQEISMYLKEIGIEKSDFRLMDASGLSSRNLISSKSLVSILSSIATDKDGESFIKLLPKFAKEGTLKNRMKGKTAANYMIGKSGSIASVISYIGYFQIEDTWYSFAIMIDHWNGQNYRSVINGIEHVLQATFEDISK